MSEFLRANNEAKKVEEKSPERLNGCISDFVVAVRRNNGKDVDPSCLTELIYSFNQHLKACMQVSL